MSVDQAVGLNVHTRMFQRKIPQTRMAARMGITQSALSKKLHGERPWSLDELYAIAGLLGCDVRDLLPHLDSNQKPFVLRAA